jgi:hypothetical protein
MGVFSAMFCFKIFKTYCWSVARYLVTKGPSVRATTPETPAPSSIIVLSEDKNPFWKRKFIGLNHSANSGVTFQTTVITVSDSKKAKQRREGSADLRLWSLTFDPISEGLVTGE